MPEPIEYRIVQSLQTALRGIAIANGYHHDVAVLAVKLDANSAVEDLIGDEARRPFFILELTKDAFIYQPAGRARIQMPAIIHAVHESDPTEDESWVRTYYRLCADIERAVALDLTRGGFAIDTRVLSRTFQTFNGAQVWAMVETSISLIRIYGEPDV